VKRQQTNHTSSKHRWKDAGASHRDQQINKKVEQSVMRTNLTNGETEQC